ncbi:hypothetical protein [Aurantibacillus circumpalustris]|uniref:hypothetical protein n=1 Tax=Aurantibacillus circumpalustris TaxID=3036359 RepID=UPI00295AF75D|nr:hypothetical protein [Aurantibacillus circumpalustris]
MKNQLLKIPFILLLLSSCIVRSPKYTTLEKVLAIELGMSKTAVDNILGIQPYDLKTRNDTCTTFLYVYRLTDRRTFAFNTKPVNGKKVIGDYVKVAIAYSLEDKVISIESCSQCSDNLERTKKIDFGKVLVFVTVTLPVLLIYFGLKQ